MKHRHLVYAPDAPVEDWPVAAIVDVLERGDLSDWKPIAVAVARDPHGPFAMRLAALVDAYPAYGTSALWRAWIERRRAAAETTVPAPPVGLAQLRRRMGLTQVEVARRIGISQSDLSKLARRKDLRLSSLATYAAALGRDLRIVFQGSGGAVRIRLGEAGKSRRAPRRRAARR